MPPGGALSFKRQWPQAALSSGQGRAGAGAIVGSARLASLEVLPKAVE